MKLREAGVFNDTLIKMIRQNVRIPDTVMGDLNAQVAACTVAARRLAELADGYGHNQLALDLRRAPATVGDDDPQGAPRHPRGHLSVRRLPRQ